MKTAVSIPDDLFQGAERLARRKKKSRSQLYSDALREYVQRHAPEEVTESLNRLCEGLDESEYRFSRAATSHLLRRSEW